MKAGWQFFKFSEICELKKGRKPLLHAAQGPGFKPYLIAKYLRGSESAEFASEGDKNSIGVAANEIIVICDGSNSGETFIGFDGILSSTMAKIAHGDTIDTRFLLHYLGSLFEQFSSTKTGSAIPHLDLPALRQQLVPVPSLPEQQRIVTLLDEAFDGIATAKVNAEKNLLNARDLFASHLQTVFSQDGEGWTVRSVQQLVSEGILAKPQDGNHGEIHPTKADYVDAGVPFVMAADLSDGAVDTENCRFISEKQARTLRIGFAKSGDVLLSHKGTIGRVAVLETNDDYIVLTPQVTYYRSLDSQRLYNGFLYYCLLSPVFQTEMNRIADAGSTRAYIGITRQLDLQIAMPSINAQHELASRLRNIQETAERLEAIYQQKLTALDDLKKSLLHRAFNGDL